MADDDIIQRMLRGIAEFIDGVVDTPLPGSLSIDNNGPIDDVIKRVARSDTMAATEISMLFRAGVEARTATLAKNYLREQGAENVMLNAMEDMAASERRFTSGMLRGALDGFDWSNTGFNGIDDFIVQLEQQAFAQAEQMFEARVKPSLDRGLDDLRRRRAPPANDEPEYDGSTRPRSEDPLDDITRPRYPDPPANDNLTRSQIIGRLAGKTLGRAIPFVGAGLALLGIREAMRRHSDMVDQAEELNGLGLLNDGELEALRRLRDNIRDLQLALEGVGVLPGLSMLSGIAADTAGRMQLDSMIEQYGDAIADISERRNTLDSTLDTVESIGDSLAGRVSGAGEIDESGIDDELRDLIEVDRNGDLVIRDDAPLEPDARRELQEWVNGINRQLQQIRDGELAVDQFIDNLNREISRGRQKVREADDMLEELRRDLREIHERKNELFPPGPTSALEGDNPVALASADVDGMPDEFSVDASLPKQGGAGFVRNA